MHTTTSAALANQLQSTYTKLCYTLALLEPDEIEQARLPSGWSPKALLAHVAFWDEFHLRRMQGALRGEGVETIQWPAQDNEQRIQVDATRDWSEVAQAADTMRQQLVAFAQSLTPAMLSADYPIYEEVSSLVHLLMHLVRHTQEHTTELQHYCGSLQRWSRPALRKFLVQQHTDLMDSIGGLTEATILATRVCGEWTIRDVLAHVLSWNEFAYRVMKQWPKPDKTALQAWLHEDGATNGSGFDAINARLLAASADLDMIAIVDWLTTYHRRMIRLFDQMSDAELASQGDYAWGETGEAARLFYEFSLHEAEHAEQIWRYRAGRDAD